jgi:hypothetical protein
MDAEAEDPLRVAARDGERHAGVLPQRLRERAAAVAVGFVQPFFLGLELIEPGGVFLDEVQRLIALGHHRDDVGAAHSAFADQLHGLVQRRLGLARIIGESGDIEHRGELFEGRGHRSGGKL